MAGAEPRRIDWGSAVVEDGDLEVELSGASSKEWRARFERVLGLLGTSHGGWGEIRVTKKRLHVRAPAEGAEEELRHFLESAVVEANAELQDGAEADRSAAEPAEPDPGAERDRRMTMVFRQFAAARQSVA